MSKTKEEIAAEILIAGIASKFLTTNDSVPDARAESLTRLYGIIRAGLDHPPASRLPKTK